VQGRKHLRRLELRDRRLIDRARSQGPGRNARPDAYLTVNVIGLDDVDKL